MTENNEIKAGKLDIISSLHIKGSGNTGKKVNYFS
jgi:hypothetical protein